MNLEKLTQKKPAVLGLLQFALGFTYIVIVASFFQLMKRFNPETPEFFAALMMLMLLVFSATIMSLSFFGMPVYLALKSNWTKAFKILGFTLLYALIAILVLITLIFVVKI